MEQPLVSFCFTTYKRHDHLVQTLESVRIQSYPHFEVIVSDNDPEESGRSVVEGVGDARFRYFPNGENLGMKKSFNRSLERATGTFVVMIADDDPVYPDMLQTLVTLAERHPGYGMYLGGSNYFFTHPSIASLCGTRVGMNSCLADEPIDLVRVYNPSQFLKDFFALKIFPAFLWSCGMVRREVVISKGGIPDYGTPFLGDYAFLSTMASHSGCVVINRALGHQTVHLQNFGRSQNEQLRLVAVNFIDYVSEKIRHVEEYPVIEPLMHKFVAGWLVTHLSFLRNYYDRFDPKELPHFSAFEQEVFDLPLMKPYKVKYWLKSKAPAVHDTLLAIKNKIW
ncbi:MAG TPA: glycosyltransferase family A protein [Chitinophagaceae bacterium]|jgi:glycosyltransferase involved in cell wall biosynthesis|nr:glycosyltransferase family A protein [Chitinophagaceae bacterium]